MIQRREHGLCSPTDEGLNSASDTFLAVWPSSYSGTLRILCSSVVSYKCHIQFEIELKFLKGWVIELVYK